MDPLGWLLYCQTAGGQGKGEPLTLSICPPNLGGSVARLGWTSDKFVPAGQMTGMPCTPVSFHPQAPGAAIRRLGLDAPWGAGRQSPAK
jgi:hypothetical protein